MTRDEVWWVGELEGVEEHEWWCEGVQESTIGGVGIGGGALVGGRWLRCRCRSVGSGESSGSVIRSEKLRINIAVLTPPSDTNCVNEGKRGNTTPLARPVTGSNPPNPLTASDGRPPWPLNWPSVGGILWRVRR